MKSEGSRQSHEIQAHELDVLGEADPEKYPIQPKKHSLEFLRDHAHLRFRTNMFGAIFRIRHAMVLLSINISISTGSFICILR